MFERRDNELTDLKRRVSNQVIIGKISQVDHKKARYRVKFGDIETDWIPDTQARSGGTKTWEGRDIGEQVIAASPSGDLSQAVIVGSIHTDATQAGDKGSLHRTVYPDGTTLDYDDQEKSYKLSVAEGGSFDLLISGGASIGAKGGRLTFKAPEGIDFDSDGDLTMKSRGGLNVETSKAINTRSPKFTHNGKDTGSTHQHKDVRRGSELTGEPQ